MFFCVSICISIADPIIKNVVGIQLPYFIDYRSIGRIAAFQQNFLGNTKIGQSIPYVENTDDNLGKYRHMEQVNFFCTSVSICPITMFFGKYL